MEKITAAQIECAVRERGITAWKLRSCSMCGGPLHYIFDASGRVFFDSNCDCVSYVSSPREHSFESLAATFNMQTPEARGRMWADFLAQGTNAPGQ